MERISMKIHLEIEEEQCYHSFINAINYALKDDIMDLTLFGIDIDGKIRTFGVSFKEKKWIITIEIEDVVR